MKSAWVFIGLFFLTVVIMLAGGELYLRNKLSDYTTELSPAPCRKDDTTGWINKQIVTNSPSFSTTRETISITHTADGRRIASADESTESNGRDQLVIVGGSLTYGYGLSDEETWPWLLQGETSCLKVLNYGTIGYGTYQCLLMLEKVLPELSSPTIVIYGFMEHHLIRNVAPPDWQAVLAFNRRGDVYLPRVDIDKNSNLVRYPPDLVKRWPLDQSLAIVRIAEVMYLKAFQRREYLEKMDAAWQLIMLNMKDLCARHGCRLVVAILSLTNRSEKLFYTTFFDLNNIDYIDGVMEMSPDLLLEKDPFHHPNHTANAVWAGIISEHIRCRENGRVEFVKR